MTRSIMKSGLTYCNSKLVWGIESFDTIASDSVCHKHQAKWEYLYMWQQKCEPCILKWSQAYTHDTESSYKSTQMLFYWKFTFKNIKERAIVAPGAVTSILTTVPSIIYKATAAQKGMPSAVAWGEKWKSADAFLTRGSNQANSWNKTKQTTCAAPRLWSPVERVEKRDCSWWEWNQKGKRKKIIQILSNRLNTLR